MICEICNQTVINIVKHTLEEHNIPIENYIKTFPDSKIIKEKFYTEMVSKQKNIPRSNIINNSQNIEIYGVEFPVYTSDLDFCLPFPEYYTLPKEGKMRKCLESVAISLKNNRSLYIWGLPGTGKDAFFHAFSFLTRTPSEIYTIRPGEDIQSWFFLRSFDTDGTKWEEGSLLKKLRDGYQTVDGEIIPYIIIFSDFDRADKNQLEALRLILDSISGRIKGPQGITYKVMKGTQFVFTANSSGSGDFRGRCISSNPIDASIFERIERKYQFHWMDWKDEKEILKRKFPLLTSSFPDIYAILEKIVFIIRKAISSDDLFFEFGHRILCSWLGHAEDILRYKKTDKMNASSLLRDSAICWIDSVSDPQTQINIQRLIDPYITAGFLQV